MQLHLRLSLMVLFAVLCPSCLAGIPVIYSTDLFHPFDDPDDHFDLATLFALPELDIKGIIIDSVNLHEHRAYQNFPKQPGIVPLQQMFHLSRRRIYATSKGFEALPDPPAPGAESVTCYEMRPVALALVPAAQPVETSQSDLSRFQATFDVTGSTMSVLKKQEPDYTNIMTSCMTHILNAHPLAGHASSD